MQRARSIGSKRRMTCFQVDFKVVKGENIKGRDFVGCVDPYFVLHLEESLSSYRSCTVHKTSNPVWEETIHLQDIPVGHQIWVKLMDRNVGPDSQLGTAVYTFNPEQGTTEGTLEEQLAVKKNESSSHLKGILFIEISYKVEIGPGRPRITGPVRYSKRVSKTAGQILHPGDHYSVWKIALFDIPYYFNGKKSHWNVNYDKAAAIFQGTTLKSALVAQHQFLYKDTARSEDGILQTADDFFKLLHYGERKDELRYFTYVLTDYDMRFSETGAAFLMDMASKHAMHAGVAEEVYYAGEFLIVKTAPDSDSYKLVIDNNSGTYAPHPDGLVCLEALLHANFPGMVVETVDSQDTKLLRYHEAVPSR